MPFDMDRTDYVTEYIGEPERMQILTESEFLLGEAQSDMRKIIKQSARAVVTDYTVTDGRVNFKGKLRLNIIYLSKNGDLASYKNDIAFEDFMNSDNISREGGADVEAENESIDVWNINERKIGVKAVSSVYAHPFKINRSNIVSRINDKDVQTLKSEKNIRNHKANFTSSFGTHNSLSLPAGKPDAGEVLEDICTITDAQAKPMRDGYRVTAVIKADITYTPDGDDTLAQSVHYEIPFDVTAQGTDIDENSRLSCRAYIEDVKSGVFQDNDGKNRVLDLDVKIGTAVEAGRDETTFFIEDAYCLNQSCTTEKTEIILPQFVGANKTRVQIKGQPAKTDGNGNIMQIVASEGRILDESVYVSENMAELEGIAEIKIMYIAENDSTPVGVMLTAIPFHQEIEVAGAKEGDIANVNTRIESIYINLLQAQEAEPSVDIAIDAEVYRIGKNMAVSDISQSQEKPAEISPAVIYAVQNGDTLWSIAKKYRTTVNDIEAINNIENGKSIQAGDKLLIMRSVK